MARIGCLTTGVAKLAAASAMHEGASAHLVYHHTAFRTLLPPFNFGKFQELLIGIELSESPTRTKSPM